MNPVLLLAAVLALFPFDGVAGEKQIVDVNELTGSWQDWITRKTVGTVLPADPKYGAGSSESERIE
jgi:hypothetical protein